MDNFLTNKRKMKELKTRDFFNSLDKEGLNTWESIYLDLLNKTTNDANISTGKNYTKDELIKLHKLCNNNLKEISEAIKRNF